MVLSGNYGNTALSSLPSLTTSSVTRTCSTSLAFTATANGASVNLGPFYDAHGHNYTVYWAGNGQQPGGGSYRLVNAAAVSCSASRTCRPPTVASPCSGPTTAPPTTTGR